MPEDQRVGEVRPITPAVAPPPAVKLDHGFTFVIPGGQGLLGDMKYTLLDGDYVLHGEDERGSYYRHKERGIVRSGNFGMADRGGLFVPHDRSKSWGLWMVPHGNDVAIGLFGAAGAGIPMPDQKKNVVYLANIPPTEAAKMNGLF